MRWIIQCASTKYMSLIVDYVTKPFESLLPEKYVSLISYAILLQKMSNYLLPLNSLCQCLDNPFIPSFGKPKMTSTIQSSRASATKSAVHVFMFTFSRSINKLTLIYLIIRIHGGVLLWGEL